MAQTERAGHRVWPRLEAPTVAETEFNPTVRDFKAIVRELPRNPKPSKQRDALARCLRGRVPGDYLSLLKRLGRNHEFAADFRFLGARDLGPENSLRECPKVGLGVRWWVFATTGTGDGWLVRCSTQSAEIAFLDHDQEFQAEAKPLGIDFKKWVQLADLMRQVERAEDADERLLDASFDLEPFARRKVQSAMATISRSLVDRYPCW